MSFLIRLLCCLVLLSSGYAQANTAPPPPVIDAPTYALVDYHSGQLLVGQNADLRREPASLTKVMTVYIVLQEIKAGKIKLSDQVVISENAWRKEGSRTFVEVGKTVPLEVLLKGLIVQSGNDATVALAEHVAGSEEIFASIMNQTAQKLGMKNSHFVNSTGLPDPNHYTTANDMLKLTRALIRDFPEHYSWYSLKEFSYNGITQHNRNKLLWLDARVDGVKTGHTESAGYCLISSAKQGDMRLMAIVMGSVSEDTRALESQKLLGYGFRFYETRRLYQANQVLLSPRVWKGEQDKVSLGVNQTLYLTLPRGKFAALKPMVKVNPRLMAPISKGKSYGHVELMLDGRKTATLPLVALQSVPEGGFFSRMVDDVKLMLE